MSLRWAKNSCYFIYTSSVAQYEHCVIVEKFLQREICKLEFYNNCNPREKDIVLTQSVSPGIGTQYKVCLSIVTLFSESVLISWCFFENKFIKSKWLSWVKNKLLTYMLITWQYTSICHRDSILHIFIQNICLRSVSLDLDIDIIHTAHSAMSLYFPDFMEVAFVLTSDTSYSPM